MLLAIIALQPRDRRISVDATDIVRLDKEAKALMLYIRLKRSAYFKVGLRSEFR